MVPVFKPYELSEETNAKAIAMDVELQEYLSEYTTRQMEREEVNTVIDPEPPADVDVPMDEETLAKEGWQQLYPETTAAPRGEVTNTGKVDKLPF